MILLSLVRTTARLTNECFCACRSWLGPEDVVVEEPWLLDQELVPVLLSRRLRGLAYTSSLIGQDIELLVTDPRCSRAGVVRERLTGPHVYPSTLRLALQSLEHLHLFVLTMNLNLTVGQLLELGLGLSAIYNLALVVILLHRKLCHCVVRREI